MSGEMNVNWFPLSAAQAPIIGEVRASSSPAALGKKWTCSKALIIFPACLFLLSGDIAFAQTTADERWKNYFGINYLDTPSNRIRYAKQMGYDYITLRGSSWDSDAVKAAMAAQGVTGLKFYINNPHMTSGMMSTLPDYAIISNLKGASGGVNIVSGHAYTEDQKRWYNQRMAQGTAAAWPNNLAPGWYDQLPNTDNPQGIFTAIWDFQQQAVIDEVVGKIIALMRASESSALNFKCDGWTQDVPTLNGDFHKLQDGGQPNTTISYWTGTDSGLLYRERSHEYPTYADGVAAFYKQLRIAITEVFPGAKWIIDPSRIYAPPASGIDDWISKIKDRADKNDLTPELLMEEGASTDFVDLPLNFGFGLNITKDRVGSHQRTKVEEDRNRLIAAKAGINGAWYNWFMLFGWPNASAGWTMPYWTHVADVYPRIKLIRHIPNWDNLNKIPLSNRACVECAKIYFNNTTNKVEDHSNHDLIVYESTDSAGNIQSHVDKDVMYSRHPGGVANSANKGKLFAVFNSTNGVIKISPGETISSVRRANEYFEEGLIDASGDVNIIAAGGHLEISLNASVVKQIDIDTVGTNEVGIGQVKGNGYILTLSHAATTAPVITSALSSTGTAGTAFSYQITAVNSPTNFNAAGLPTGLSVSTGGLISGTPSTIGTSSVTISATNAGGTGSAGLTLSVYSACDVNRDGSTNVVDVQLQVNQALGVAACTSDLNRDGFCNVIDVQRGVNAGLGGQCVLGP